MLGCSLSSAPDLRMKLFFSVRFLRRFTAVWLLAVSSASFAAAEPISDELLAPLTSAYVRAAKPGKDLDLHRELFATVLQRVQRSYAQEVDMSELVSVALKAIEPLDPLSTEPSAVFSKAVNAALASLDPHSRYMTARERMNQRS